MTRKVHMVRYEDPSCGTTMSCGRFALWDGFTLGRVYVESTKDRSKVTCVLCLREMENA